MNPLSAIRAYVPPTINPSGADITRSSGLKSISTAEIQELSPAVLAPPTGRTQGATGFGEVLSHLVGEVNEKQGVASRTVSGLLSGDNVSLQQAMVSMEEASVSFQLMVEVRNKLLEAYQEIMRMQV